MYILDWVSISVAGWPWKTIDPASLQQSRADGVYCGDF